MLFLVILLALSFALTADTPPAYTVQTVAGTDYVGDGASATLALLSQTEGIAVDSAGNLYVADADDSRVRKVLASGLIQTVAGTGVAGFNGESGQGTQIQLDHPYGLALDFAGNLFIADLGNARIRKLTPDGLLITIAGGGATVPGTATDGLLATNIQLNTPRNVAIDSGGSVYISDFGANQIFRVASGGIFTTVAGTGKAGYSGNNGLARTAQLSAPAGLAVDLSGTLYVADSGNNRVRKISRGVIAPAFTVNGPTGLTVTASGTVYVAGRDYFGTFTHAIGSGIIARDVAVDSTGNLYLTGKSLVRKLGTDGTVKVIAGNGAARYFGGDGGPAALARMHNPSGIAEDDLGNVYIADTDNHRIRRISAGIITTFAGTGDKGTGLGNGNAALAQLNSPRGVAIDSLRNVYVADTGNNRIVKITPAGVFSAIYDKLSDPEAIAIDATDQVFLADTGNNRVLKLAQDGTVSPVVDALKPVGLALDRGGTLFISESSRVSKVPADGSLTTALDNLKSPRGLGLTAAGDLVVAEAGANRIRILKSGGASFTIAGTGLGGFSGDLGTADQAQFYGPTGVAIDSSGNILVSDTGNQRVRSLAPVNGGGIADPITQVTVVNAASLAQGPIAPSEIVTIFGNGFDPAKVQVSFDGIPAIIFYASTTQINALTPATLKPGAASDMTIQVEGTLAAEALIPVATAVPAVFTVGQGTGQAAALNEDGGYNADSTPASRGSIVSLFATGWDGSQPIDLSIGGYSAEVVYAGPAPGFLGLKQINARIPGGFLGPGAQNVVLQVGGAASQSGVTLAVR